MSAHNTPNVAFGPEIVLEAFKPILDAEIEELKPLLPRIPRQATYQTLTLQPGQVVQLIGFDASRQNMTLNAINADIAIALDRSGADSAQLDASTNPSNGPYFILPTGTALQLRNQAPLWAKNIGTVVGALSYSVESHSIA